MYKRVFFLSLVVVSLVFSSFTLSKAEDVKSTSSDYYIYNNDLLDIKVYQEPDLSQTLRVSSDGTISFPLLGKIQVKGLTAKKLESMLTEMLTADYLVNPQVTVFIKEYAKYSILGQVIRPGSYEIKPGLTVMGAISQANGLTDKANAEDVKLTRVKEGAKETIALNVKEISENNKKENDLPIEPGDLIVVGSLGNIEVDNAYVFISGQVKKPGKYNFRKGMRVLELVSEAGGLTDIASPNAVKIIRKGEGEGKSKSIKVPLGAVMNGDTEKDVELVPDDSVVVPESFF